jgi:hypothetical protein
VVTGGVDVVLAPPPPHPASTTTTTKTANAPGGPNLLSMGNEIPPTLAGLPVGCRDRRGYGPQPVVTCPAPLTHDRGGLDVTVTANWSFTGLPSEVTAFAFPSSPAATS